MDGGEVPLYLRFFVAAHRAVCPTCRRYERSLRHTVELGHALRDLPLEDDDAGNDGTPKPT
jgi:hypothetical protein